MEEFEQRKCDFERYVKQTMDLLKDAYKWKLMAEYCETDEMAEKYMKVSNTLMELFMVEHNNIGAMFKE